MSNKVIRVNVGLSSGKPRLGDAVGRAYCAGLFDGEGCVCIVRQLKSTARRKHIFRLVVSVAQNHLGTLADFQQLTGKVGRIYQIRRQGPANRDSFSLNYAGDAAAELLDTLLPYLVRKHDEAVVALQFQRESEVTRHFGRNGCPEHIWLKREKLYTKLRSLK